MGLLFGCYVCGFIAGVCVCLTVVRLVALYGFAVCNVGFRAKLRAGSACLFVYSVLVTLLVLVCQVWVLLLA